MNARQQTTIPQAPVASFKASGRRRIGRVVANTGRDVLVMIEHNTGSSPDDEGSSPETRPGSIVIMPQGGRATVGVIAGVNEPAPGLEEDGPGIWLAQVELAGSLGLDPKGPHFTKSIPIPPALGDVVYDANTVDLRRLYRNGDNAAFPVGVMMGHADVAATIDGDGLVEGGFAIIGGHGSGKSCTLASILRALLRHRHPVRTLLIDPFSEYAHCFGRAGVVIAPTPGLLPYWLLNLDELVYLLSYNRGPLDQAEKVLLEQTIPLARHRHLSRITRVGEFGALDAASLDGPVPYRLNDLISILERVEADDKQAARVAAQALKNRLQAAAADPRLSLIFGAASAADVLGELIRTLFRLGSSPQPLAVLQLGNLAPGVDRIAVSIVARLATAVAEWGEQNDRVMVLLDDASRFAPAASVSTELDEASVICRTSLRRLADRARKLGTTLGLVSSDVRHVESAILNQCSTFFLHHIRSQTEIDMVEDLLPEAATAFLNGVVNLGQAEIVAIGKGVPLTGRMAIAALPQAAIPKEKRDAPSPEGGPLEDRVEAIIARWRRLGTGDENDAVS